MKLRDEIYYLEDINEFIILEKNKSDRYILLTYLIQSNIPPITLLGPDPLFWMDQRLETNAKFVGFVD